MNVKGDILMATGVLRAFGLDDPQIERAKDAWLEIPDACCDASPTFRLKLTIRQYFRLLDKADAEGLGVDQYLNRKLDESAFG